MELIISFFILAVDAKRNRVTDIIISRTPKYLFNPRVRVGFLCLLESNYAFLGKKTALSSFSCVYLFDVLKYMIDHLVASHTGLTTDTRPKANTFFYFYFLI